MSYDPLIVYPKEPKLIAYGWGIVDKDGKPKRTKCSYPTKEYYEHLAELWTGSNNSGAPFRVVPIFYKEEE